MPVTTANVERDAASALRIPGKRISRQDSLDELEDLLRLMRSPPAHPKACRGTMRVYCNEVRIRDRKGPHVRETEWHLPSSRSVCRSFRLCRVAFRSRLQRYGGGGSGASRSCQADRYRPRVLYSSFANRRPCPSKLESLTPCIHVKEMRCLARSIALVGSKIARKFCDFRGFGRRPCGLGLKLTVGLYLRSCPASPFPHSSPPAPVPESGIERHESVEE